MKYTNKAELPQAIVDAIINDEYSKGDADYSASNLINPPQIYFLMQLFGDDVTVDVSDEIFKLLGSSVHYILEKSSGVKESDLVNFYQSNFTQMIDSSEELRELWGVSPKTQEDVNKLQEDITGKINEIISILDREPPKKTQLHTIEERLYGSIGGIVVSGKPDWMEAMVANRIDDYKVTSTWKILHGDYEDYTAQLNIYRWLALENQHKIDNLRIIAILKDWKKSEKGRYDDYPEYPVEKIDLPVWSYLETTSFILERVKRLENAKAAISDPRMSLEEKAQVLFKNFPCSAKDRWKKEDKFAVVKPGNKRATKVLDKLEEAQDFIKESGQHVIEPRLGEDTRCLEFCPVSQFCAQFNSQHNKQNLIVEEDKPVEFPSEPYNTLKEVEKESKALTEETVKEINEEKKKAEEETKEEKPMSDFEKKILEMRKEAHEHMDKQKAERENADQQSNSKPKTIDDLLQGLGLGES